MNNVQPLFRWAGGKSKMMKHYNKYIPYKVDCYVEPFFGAGAFYTQTCFENAIINDINDELMRLYSMIKTRPDELIRQSQKLEQEYLSLSKFDRKIFYYSKREEYWMDISNSALLFFLMKTSFNGIWQTCKKANGAFATPCGLLDENKPFIDEKAIMLFSKKLQYTTICSGDYNKLDIPDGSFIFCDPPYRQSFANYNTPFDDNKQIELIRWAERQRNNGCEVWISNRECGDGFWETNAPGVEMLKFPVVYTAGRRLNTETGFEAKPAEEVLLIIK